MFQLAHLALVVKDSEQSADFYSRVLGCTITDRLASDLLKIIYLQYNDFSMELLEYTADSPALRGAGIYDHLAFMVSDIKAAMTDLRGKGIIFETDAPRPGLNGSKIIFFTGPDGERIELLEKKRC